MSHWLVQLQAHPAPSCNLHQHPAEQAPQLLTAPHWDSATHAQAYHTPCRWRLPCQHQHTDTGPSLLKARSCQHTQDPAQLRLRAVQSALTSACLLFGAAQNSPTSKGCGLVVMRSHADAAAAISGLDNYKWEGMHSTMVVKLMPPQRQRAISGKSICRRSVYAGSSC